MPEPVYYFRVVRNVKENKDYTVLPVYKKTIFTHKLSNGKSEQIIRDIVKNRSQYKSLQLLGDISRENPFGIFAFSKGDINSRFFISERKLEELLEVFSELKIREFIGPKVPRQWVEKTSGSATIAYPVFGGTVVSDD